MVHSKPTGAWQRALRNCALAAIVLPFVACVSSGPTTPATGARPADTTALLERARAAARSGNFAAAADLYGQLAAAATGPARIDYLLESARAALDEGDNASARRRLADVRGTTSRDQQQLATVLEARLDLADRRPQAVLDRLATLQQPISVPVLRDAAAVRGQALFQLGRPVDAVRALVEREIWLDDAASILANQRLIWNGFQQYPPPAAPTPTGDRIVDGWLALAPIAAAAGGDLRRALLGWRQTYTDHPAAGGLLAELLAEQRSASFPAQVALLLPLSSAQRSFALAIRDGFMAAYLAHNDTAATTIRVYDTTALGSQQAYLRAQLDGAEFIVGPLLRPEVDQVIAQAGFVPTLALNYAQGETKGLGSFFQFALAPADEATEVADAAAARGARTAIALVPSNDRGYAILGNFRGEFEARGGQLLDFNGYDPALQDFSQTIAGLLNVTRSNQRERRLAANLGTPLQFEPRRRQDVDMIFVVADSATARLLTPQLKFFSAADIPTYATADVFTPGGAARDNDLNGVIFADTPSLLAPDADATELAKSLQSYWPQRSSLLRYFGMGFDAYRLIAPLYAGAEPWPLEGMSGNLTVDGAGRIHRGLDLAQFRNGRPVMLDTTSGFELSDRRTTPGGQ
jgi:outer membrane PBP1 activator LpoA protein